MTITLERPKSTVQTTSAGLRLTPALLRVFLFAVVGLQVVKSATVPNSVYAKSMWFVDYRYGFVRRGLGGQITGQSDLAVNAALIICWIVPIVAILIVLELLVRRWTTASTFLALLIACSPFVVDELVYYRRTDELAVIVLVLTGVACLRLRRWLLPAVGGLGLVLAVLVFVHEASLLIWGLAAVPVVFVTGNRSWLRNVHLSAAAIGPAFLSLLVVVVAGKVTPAVATQLREDAGLRGPTVFRYLVQGVSDSIGEVYYVGLTKHLAQLTVGAMLVLVHVLWIRRSVGFGWLSRFTRVDRRTATAIALLVGSAVVAVFATGTDWMRWFSNFGTAALVVVAFAVLSVDEEPMVDRTVTLSWTQVATIVYLTILTPTPEIEPNVPVPDVSALFRLWGP